MAENLIEIYRDNELKATVRGWQAVYKYMHDNTTTSIAWAVKYEGWRILPVEDEGKAE